MLRRRSLLIVLLVVLLFAWLAVDTAHADEGTIPWPLYQNDVGRTGHTNVSLEGNGGGIEWKLWVGSTLAPPAIGVNNTIYLSERNGLYSIDPDGSVNWVYHHPEPAYSSPAIGVDGTVYFATGAWDSYYSDRAYGLYALNPDGRLLWIVPLPRGGTYSSPLLTSEGIYLGTASGQMLSITTEGELRWKYDTYGTIFSSPSMGVDGSVCFTSGDGHLYYLWPNGTLRWSYYAGGQQTGTPVIDDQGTIYLAADGKGLLSFSPDGQLLWGYVIPETGWTNPSLGPDGRIYLVVKGTLYAISTSGSLIWEKDGFYGTPITDSSGLVIIPRQAKEGRQHEGLAALYPNGDIEWTVTIDDGFFRAGPAVVDGNGVIYLNSDRYLYAIDNDPIRGLSIQLVLESAVIVVAIAAILYRRRRKGGSP